MPTEIEWADETWNPVTGCSSYSIGCAHCYAKRIAERFKRDRNPKYRNGFKVTTHPDALGDPLKMKRSKLIFVCSMGDLFHNEVPASFIEQVMSTMRKAHWHTFVLLTKRADRLASWPTPFPRNVWPGVSVESQAHTKRLEKLRKVDARVRVVSFEPLVGEIWEFDTKGIGWVIVGGEQGVGARKMEDEWVNFIVNTCHIVKVPIFFKQWGSAHGMRDARVDGFVVKEVPHRHNEQAHLF